MAETKTYVPKSSAKEVTFQDGGSLIRLSFKAAELVEFINQHANAKGYINLTVAKRREVGQYGDTHSVCLDTWQPKQTAGQSPAQPQRQPDELPSGNSSVPF